MEARVGDLAHKIWSYSLETFRVVSQSLAQDATQLGRDGSWLATQHFDRLEILDEIAAAEERKLKLWARAVNVHFDPPTDGPERLQWEKALEKKVVAAGAKALKRLK